MMMVEVCNARRRAAATDLPPMRIRVMGRWMSVSSDASRCLAFCLLFPRHEGTHVTMPEVALIKTAKLVIRSPNSRS